MYTYPILKKPFIFFSPGTSETWWQKSISEEHPPTDDVSFGKRDTDEKLVEGRENLLLLIFADWRTQHGTKHTGHNVCWKKQTLTGSLKTVKAMYLGHFLNTIPKYQGSPSVSYKSSWDACWKLYINSLHVSVPMIPTPLETAYFPLLSKWRPPSKWVTPDSQEINYSKNSIQGPGSVKTLKSHDTVGDSTTWPWTYEHWMRSTTCKVLIRMKARERRLKWWTNPFPFPPWAI